MENQRSYDFLPGKTDTQPTTSSSGKKKWLIFGLMGVLAVVAVTAYFLAGGNMFKGQMVTGGGITLEASYSSDVNAVNLSWNDALNPANISRYVIYRIEDNKKKVLASLSSAAPKSYIDKNIMSGKIYVYSVRSMGKRRGGVLADSASITIIIDSPLPEPSPEMPAPSSASTEQESPPSSPQVYSNPILSVGLNPENQPVLTWTDDTPYVDMPNGEISKKIYNYSLYRGKQPDLSDQKWHGDIASAFKIFTETDDLEPEATYYYTLKTNGDGPSGEKILDVTTSNSASITMPFFDTKQLTILSAATPNKNEIQLKWQQNNMPGFVELYTVYRSTESLPGSAVGPSIRGSSKNMLKTFNDYGFDAPMINGQTYFYKMTAIVAIPGILEKRKIVSNEVSAIFQSE